MIITLLHSIISLYCLLLPSNSILLRGDSVLILDGDIYAATVK